MNDKRAAQLLVIPYIVWQLADGATDHTSCRVRQYIELFGLKLIPDDKKRFKISKRVFRCVKDIMQFVAKDDKYSGHKVVLMLFHLAQSIFDSQEDLKLCKDHYWLKRIYFILDFILETEHKERYTRLDSEADFDKLENSARKQAAKIYELFYKTI